MIFEKNLVSVLVNDTGAIIFEYKFVMNVASHYNAQKMKFSLKDFFSKCDQMRRKLRIWSHLLKKSLMENLIFCALVFGKKSKLTTVAIGATLLFLYLVNFWS